jgi:hypothetical protein
MSTQGICKSYLLETQQGVHIWGTDVFKLALYTDAALLDPDVVTAYSALNEVAGVGYVAGGVVLALTATYPKLSATSRKVLWDFADVVINPGIFTARQALIYNASKANRGFAVIDFTQNLQATASFSIFWPDPTDSGAAVTLGA